MKLCNTFILLAAALLFFSCGGNNEISNTDTSLTGKDFYFFYYTQANDAEKLTAEILRLPESIDFKTAADTVMQRLSGYFSRQFSSLPQSDVKFELQKIEPIETDSKNYRIAVVNIDDPGKIMERGYFQGSTGGKVTQDIILLNILQPHLEGFLDGCIILLNNQSIGNLDHINLEGIKTADAYSHAARRAVLNKGQE
jgi:hypothetical protein